MHQEPGKCCQGRKAHRCSCQEPVSVTDPEGLALQSDNPVIREQLAKAFTAHPRQEGVFLAGGADFLERVEGFVGELSEMERRSIRAVQIGEGGTIDGWASAPVNRVLLRLRTPWLPQLLNEELLEFHMQPIVEANTMKVFGFEALMRCADPTIKANPFELISAAKAHDALLKLDQIARRQAILQCAPKLQGEERLFVNFLPLTVYDPEVCLRTTFKAAKDSGIDFGRIVFEVVESEEFPDIDHLSRILDKYREAGNRVALDDLGAGNTSLNYIERLKPDFIKIDREIVCTAAKMEQFNMLRGLVAHAKDLGITVLGEGVETLRELDMLREMGVDLIQGWVVAKPALEPVREFDPSVPRLAA